MSIAARKRWFPSHGWPRCPALVLVAFVSTSLDGRAADSSLQVEPSSVALDGKLARQQLAITLRDADGSLRDVTSQCRFESEPRGIATVVPGGVVVAAANGSGVVRATFQNQTADIELRVERAASIRTPSFRTDIAPLLSKAGCNMGACHGNLNGKGGFKLSLRGDEPSFDYQSLTHDQSGRRLSNIAPESSLIVLKPTGAIPHEGGLRFANDSTEARALLAWIAAGANDDRASAPRVKALRVYPSERILAPGALGQQLVVTAHFADGTSRDVTRQAAYDVSDPTRAEVSADGQVHAHGPCETTVAIRHMNGRATSRLAFLADRPGFVWCGREPRGTIDTVVFARLKALRINPSPVCSDPVFLRRAFLDAIGRLPDPMEARAFLDSKDPAKRDKLIDRLVERPEFADFWALNWADLLRNEEKTMGEKGSWVLQRWLRDQLAVDIPLDRMVRKIVTGLGSTWQNPPASFYRTNRDPTAAAESVGQVFLGIRLQCARCHNHPYDVWTQDDYFGLAAFFANIARKQPSEARKDRLDLHEINGDESIYLSGRAEMVQPRTGTLLHPKCLNGPTMDRGAGEDGNALSMLANWLTQKNPQFSRNLANRVWFHLLGRGIVDPVDDFRESNPPSNPALLDVVTAFFEANTMRLKPLVGWIMKSQTYQLIATPNPSNADDAANFSHSVVRLLPAEVLLDAISQVVAVPEAFPHAPGALRAAQLPGASGGIAFLKSFGKPDRLLTCECERSESTTLAQAFQMINGETVRKKLEMRSNRIGQALDSGRSDSEILDDVYLAALARQPTPVERTAVSVHIRRGQDRRKAWEDVLWALLNSKEFLLRH
jgi:Protein of unknown function (DUF1549)/Protein of unknown function (DUF1553)